MLTAGRSLTPQAHLYAHQSGARTELRLLIDGVEVDDAATIESLGLTAERRLLLMARPSGPCAPVSITGLTVRAALASHSGV